VVPPEEVVLHFDDVLVVLWVVGLQVVEHSHLYDCLLMKSLLVPYYFKGHEVLRFMVESFQHLSKRPFPKLPYQLVPVENMIVHLDYVVAPLIVEPATLPQFLLLKCLGFLVNIVNLFEVENLSELILREEFGVVLGRLLRS